MTQLDALLQRSQSPGNFLERRTFSLARAKAVEKMREFTLRHPNQYILELMQSAVFGGATWVAVDITSERMMLGFIGGVPLKKAELEHLFDFLFVDQTESKTRHLMQMAVGVNALLQKKPAVIRIESGDGTDGGTTRLDLSGGGEGEVGIVEEPLVGTYVYAEFERGWLERFSGTTTSGPVVELVDTRCLYTPVPILLNGRAPFGYTANRNVRLFGVKAQLPVEGVHRRGAVGTLGAGSATAGTQQKSQFRIVMGGVWVTTMGLPVGPGLTGVVCDDGLRKTADMSDIVKEERYVDMLYAVRDVGTKLLKKQMKHYRPPELPARIRPSQSSASGKAPVKAGVAPERLPVIIEAVGARHSVKTAQLPNAEAQGFLFYVTPEDLKNVQLHVDPLAFPYPVLVLTVGQALTLERWAEKKAARRLTGPEDVGFVRRAVERWQRIDSVRLSAEEASAIPGVLDVTMRHHTKGELPSWSAGTVGVPCLFRARNKTLYAVMLPAQIDNVSVVVTLKDPKTTLNAELMAQAADVLIQASYRLLPDSLNESYRAFGDSLIALHARPFFSRDQGHTALKARFPARWWADHAQRLMRQPVASSAEVPLTLAEFVALQGTGNTVEVSPESLSALARLERRFGWGHLYTPQMSRECLIAWFKIGSRWHRVRSLEGVSRFDALITLNSSLKEPSCETRSGWSSVEVAVPGLHVRISPELEEEREAVIGQGLHTVFEEMLAWEESEDPVSHDRSRGTQRSGWGQFANSLACAERVRAMGRLALIGLAMHLNLEDTPILRNGTGKRGSLNELKTGGATGKHPRFMVGALHGVVSEAANRMLLTMDEWTLIESKGGRVSLDLDDEPEVWVEEGAFNEENWLLTQRVHAAGLRGWLGLRVPYDGTGGLLIEGLRNVRSCSEIADRIPCHGLIEHLGRAEELTAEQQNLISLAGIQLYQGLLERLAGTMVNEHRVAALKYAKDYVLRTWAREGALRSSVVMQLANVVDVPVAEERWGSLSQWLQMEPALRPDVGIKLEDASRESQGDVTGKKGLLHVALKDPLAGILKTAIPALGGLDVNWSSPKETQARKKGWLYRKTTTPLFIRVRMEHGVMLISVRLEPAHPLVTLGTAGDERATELLRVEAMRQVVVAVGNHGVRLDTMAMLQAMLLSGVVS